MSSFFNPFLSQRLIIASILHPSFWLHGNSTMAIMLSFMAMRRFSVLNKSTDLLNQCLQKLSALFSSKIMALHLRHRSAHVASQKLQQKLPFFTFGQRQMTPGGLSRPSKGAIVIVWKVTVLLVWFFKCVELFVTMSTQQSNKTKRTDN